MINNNNTENRRGRPLKAFYLPDARFMTINDIQAVNPHIECRISIYSHVGRQLKHKIIRRTGKTVPNGGVGKPLDLFERMSSFRLSRSMKRAARNRQITVTA